MAAQKEAGLRARGGQPYHATGLKNNPVEDEPRPITLAEGNPAARLSVTTAGLPLVEDGLAL